MGDPTPRPPERDGPSAVLICRAPHPKSRDGDPRFAGRIHGIRLQVVPFLARPTYRQVDDWSDARPGCVVVRCASCRAFTEYAIVGDPEPRPEGAPGERTPHLPVRPGGRSTDHRTAVEAADGAVQECFTPAFESPPRAVHLPGAP
jgi:hypothetical protein